MDSLEKKLSSYTTFIILLIVLLSLVIRIIYYHEIQYTYLPFSYHYDQTDMNFFHEWACKIVQGDYLTEQGLHPYHGWHKKIAEIVLCAEEMDAGQGKVLWNRWYGEKRFHQEPFYPYLVALIYKISGECSTKWVILFQMFVGILSNVLIFLIARHYFNNITAILSALIALFYGPFLFYEVVLLRTSLSLFTNLLCVWLLTLASKKISCFFWAGLVAAAGCLLRSDFILFIIGILCTSLFYIPKATKKIFSKIALFLSGMLIFFLPCIARNILVQAPSFSISSVGAVTFAVSNSPGFIPDLGWEIHSNNIHTIASVIQKTEGKLLPCIYETLKTHDWYSYLWLLLRKFLVVWNSDEIPNNLNYYYASLYSSLLSYSQLHWGKIVSFCLLGLILNIKNIKKFYILYFMIFLNISIMTIFYSLSRFRTSAVALMIPFAAYTVIFILKKMFSQKYLAGTVLLFLVVGLNFLSHFLTPRLDSAIRTGDYIIGNIVNLKHCQEKIHEQNTQEALLVLERCLQKTEPSFMKKIGKPFSTIILNKRSIYLIQSFYAVHLQAYHVNKLLSQEEKAQYHNLRCLRIKTFLKEIKNMPY